MVVMISSLTGFCIKNSILSLFNKIKNIPNQLTNNLKSLTMINTKVLLRALGFMFLPTVSILFLIFCWFFNWSKFSDFVTSDTIGAAILRILMVASEIALVTYMYKFFLKKFNDEEDEKNRQKQREENDKIARENVSNGEFGKLVRSSESGYDLKEYFSHVGRSFKISKLSDTHFVIEKNN